MPHSVFISHAVEDAEPAQALCNALERSGIRCWIAPRDVPPAEEYAEVIVAAVETSRVLLVLLSASANASRFVVREVSLALDSGISILPVRIEDVQATRSLRFFIQGLQRLDAFSAPLSDFMPQVLTAVRALAAESPVAEQEQPVDLEAGGGTPQAQSVEDAERDTVQIVADAINKRGLAPSNTQTNLLIFSTRKQKTWLSFTRAGVFCVLDNRAKGGRISARWFEPRANINAATVFAQDRPGQPGLLRIGSHMNWLYTKALFGSGDRLKQTILAEVERASG